MLISKKFRRPSPRFDSHFAGGTPTGFPVRQYLRCREDLGTGLLHAALILVFVALILVFGRAVDGLFVSHGAGISPWYRWGSQAMVVIFALSVLRRLCYKLVELRQIRREMRELKATFRLAKDGTPLEDEVDRHRR